MIGPGIWSDSCDWSRHLVGKFEIGSASVNLTLIAPCLGTEGGLEPDLEPEPGLCLVTTATGSVGSRAGDPADTKRESVVLVITHVTDTHTNIRGGGEFKPLGSAVKCSLH